MLASDLSSPVHRYVLEPIHFSQSPFCLSNAISLSPRYRAWSGANTLSEYQMACLPQTTEVCAHTGLRPSLRGSKVGGFTWSLRCQRHRLLKLSGCSLTVPFRLELAYSTAPSIGVESCGCFLGSAPDQLSDSSIPQFPHLVYVLEHKQLTSGYPTEENNTPTSGNSLL